MLPVVLNPEKLRVGVAGAGESLERRIRMLEAAGIKPERLDNPEGAWLLDMLFVAGLGTEASRAFAKAAHATGVLVNVEDIPELCDFHVPAAVRRGDLLLTVSTGGKAPGLARAVRAVLERIFGEEWSARTGEVAALRGRWREQGLGPQAVSARIQEHAASHGWLG